MSELNNIDRLFKEKFKDFEVTPSDRVWENIQPSINTGKKEIKPLSSWIRLCSYVAFVLIGFSLATTFVAGPFGIMNTADKATDDKSALGNNTETKRNISKNTIVKSDSFENTANKNNTVVHNEEKAGITNSKDSDKTHFNGNNKNAVGSEDLYLNDRLNGAHPSRSKTKDKSDKNRIAVSETLSENSTNSSLALNTSKATTDKDHKLSSTDKHNVIKQGPITNPEGKNILVAANENPSQVNSIQETDLNDVNNNDADFDPYINTSKVAYEAGTKYVQKKEAATYNTAAITLSAETKENTKVAVANTNAKSGIDSKSSTSFKENTIIKSDSLAAKQNKIAESAKTKKKTEEKDSKDQTEKKSKWVVSTNFSPIYMNLNGSRSSLDAKFDENSKSYQTSMSYGAGLKYELNKKWSVRTGVNVLNIEYSTNDITYYRSSEGSGLEHVNENGNGSGLVIENPSPKSIAHDENGIVTTRYSGNLNHKINYVEVPVELTYKILDRKFGIDVIGGVSSFLLNDNKVSVVSSDTSLIIGEANNLNKLHFSTNIGLGLHYSFMRNLHANVEPMLKYQINTYDNNAGNFKPYFMGIYSGISYRF
ncbi:MULTISPECIES: outer membrane beta-barrel protein [Flavobacterium]|uniref:outer membrane beta-barrel protein n=1 Tax=Flavobacterium TaxID=237 RepID=UPI001FCB6CA2|nr:MULTISPECIES: outer membrane beta-barrel protein [Flavobacterium]UOK43206.1 outer membrane beta-barrel protein [Flavobacterium enshiense]